MTFTAILLICAMPVAADACTETTAFDVVAFLLPNSVPVPVASELGCMTGWQEMIARGSLREDIGDCFS